MRATGRLSGEHANRSMMYTAFSIIFCAQRFLCDRLKKGATLTNTSWTSLDLPGLPGHLQVCSQIRRAGRERIQRPDNVEKG